MIAEVESSLVLALGTLEAFALEQNDANLQRCLDYFHQIEGCLRIAEDDGGVLLMGEMAATVDALRGDTAGNVGETCEVLAQAINWIPDGLQQRAVGQTAGLEVVMTMLNDLRAVRGEPLFSESRAFAPMLDLLAVESRAGAPVNEEDFCALLRKLRQLYQAALLGMLRDGAPDRHAAAFEKVCVRLRELCAGSVREQLWRIAGAFGEALAQHSIPWSVATRMLLRDLDREVRFCAELGSRALGEPLPEALLVNLLYYIAIADAVTPLITAVRADFRLDRALPKRREGTAQHSSRPFADDLVAAVAGGLTEELDAIKDQLEESLATEAVSSAVLTEARRGLKRIADALAVVSQPLMRDLCEAITAQLDEVIVSGAQSADIERLTVAIVDLEVEIEGWRINVAPGEGDARPVETRQALATVLAEVGRDLDAIKDVVLAYLEADRDPAVLVEAPPLAMRLAAVLELAGLERWAAIVKRWRACLVARMAGPVVNRAARDFDALADVIMAMEHALSDWLSGSRDADQMLLSIAEQSLDRLALATPLPAVNAPANVVSAGDEDRLLLETFARESAQHLEVLRQFVAAERARAPLYTSPPAMLQSALHTLKGSAHIAGIKPLAELVTQLEWLIREMLNFQVALDGDIVDLLADCADYSAHLIGATGADGDRAAHLLVRIGELRERVMALPDQDSGTPTHAVDPAPLQLIMAEGLEQVLDVEATLGAGVTTDGFDDGQLGALASELDELEVGARSAGLPPLAAHQYLEPAGEAMLSGLASLAGAAAAVDPEFNLTTAAPAVRSEDIDVDIAALFLDEATELLDVMEQDFQRWRETPRDSHYADALKRSLHTFKGGARMAGFTVLVQVCHELETAVVGGEKDIAGGDVAAIAAMLDHHDRLTSGVAAARQALLTGESYSENERSGNESSANESSRDESSCNENSPAESSASDYPGGAGLNRDNRLSAGSAAIPPFSGGHLRLDPARPDTSGQQTTPEMIKVAAPLLETLINLAGEASIARSQVEQQIADFALSLNEMEVTVRRMRDQMRRLGVETDAQVMLGREQIGSSESDEGFDPLEMDRSSELQQLTCGLLESASDLQDLRDTLMEKSREVEAVLLQQSRINRDLQAGLMHTRMMPFSRLIPRLRRSVRQVADELGKRVELRVDGVEGEMDRAILERIVPSLEHMIRNAIDHGIEGDEQRRALGKFGPGTLSLSFTREGGNILIRLADDGRGLDVEAIRTRALADGLLDERFDLDDLDIQHYIFTPGFSTSRRVTEISGRGVGMDVVNSEVHKLGGSIRIDSQRGRGTEFTLRLPFTLSVNRALMVEAGGESYALALNAISGVTRIGVDDLIRCYQNPNETFDYGGEQYQARYLGSLLAAGLPPALDTATGCQLPVVLVRGQGGNYAVQVDALIGSRDIVGKSLGAQFSRVPGVSGATVLGDGRVVVILDLQALLKKQPTVDGWTIPPAEAAMGGVEYYPTVMVVDDSVTVRKVTCRFLERGGLRVIAARDGLEAMRMLKDHTPDLMVLDIEMPGMDGFEVVRQLRSTQRLKNLPVIMVTSHSGEKHRERALSMGVDHYLGKPYQEEMLLQAVRRLLSGRGVGAGSGAAPP